MDLDSVKIGSDASLTANHTEAGLRRAAAQQADIDAEKARELAAAALAEHAATDAAEDALYGPGVRGDEVPPELVDEPSRAARIAQALAELAPDSAKAARRAAQLEAFRRRRERRRIEPMGLPPAEIRVEILTQNLVEARARQQAKIDRYHAGGKRGPKPVPVEQAYRVTRVKAALDRAIAAVEKGTTPRWGDPKRNITDPQSRAMPLRGGGWIQGYNCQAVTSSDGLIIATSVGNNLNDATAFTTPLGKALAAAALIDAHRPAESRPAGIGVLLADAGYLSADNLCAPGPDRLIAVGKSRDLAAVAREQPAAGPPPPQATPPAKPGEAAKTQRSRVRHTADAGFQFRNSPTFAECRGTG